MPEIGTVVKKDYPSLEGNCFDVYVYLESGWVCVDDVGRYQPGTGPVMDECAVELVPKVSED